MVTPTHVKAETRMRTAENEFRVMVRSYVFRLLICDMSFLAMNGYMTAQNESGMR